MELPNNRNNYLFPFHAIESTTSRITLKVKPNSMITSDNKDMYRNSPPIMLRENLPLFSHSSFNHILRFVKRFWSQQWVLYSVSAVFQNGTLQIAASFVAVAKTPSFQSISFPLIIVKQKCRIEKHQICLKHPLQKHGCHCNAHSSDCTINTPKFSLVKFWKSP